MIQKKAGKYNITPQASSNFGLSTTEDVNVSVLSKIMIEHFEVVKTGSELYIECSNKDN